MSTCTRRRSDEKLADFSVTAAREFSWNTARQLWGLHGVARDAHIRRVDGHVARVAIQRSSSHLEKNGS